MLSWGRLLVGATATLFFLSSAYGQEARGAITGRVTDATGGVISNARVVVVNTATNETRRSVTNETGYYEVNLLEPSSYTVTVEAQGFKKLVRSGLMVNVSARLEINLQLEVGSVSESVEVTADAPLLETTSASGGRVLDQKALINLPFSDLNPFALSALAPGMQWTGQPEYRRPFDNAGTSSFNTMGGVGQNEYTIDGMTVTGSGRRVGFVPPADAVSEFKLETSNFDASQGFTSGAAINVSSKSGTNRLHGSVFNQHWQQRWNATGHFQRLAWENQLASGKITPDTPKQATGRSNNYGVSASGPVVIPKVFDLRNKVFWTLTWNGIRQSKAESTSAVNRTVPTMAMRGGDFSELWSAPNGTSLYTIYDPRSARKDGSNIVRTPFPGNKGIPILNPMYQSYVAFYPTPNNVPGLVTPELRNNYLASGMPKDEKFNSIVNRYDWAINDNHRLNVRWQWNDRLADEYDWTYETVRGLHSNGLTRINKGGLVGWLWTIDSSNILDLSYGISRWEEGSRAFARTAFGPKDVGLPDYLQARAGANQVLPFVDFSDNSYQDVSGGYPAMGTLLTNHELRLQMNTIRGSHSFKYGWQERRHDFAGSGPGNSSGAFSPRNNYTRRADNDNVSSILGHEWAAFMMGMVNGISIDTNDSTYYRTPRRAFYLQDDWRVTSKFRLSIGMRYEREGGTTERYNRALSRIFEYGQNQVFTADAKAAYAKNPIPELPVSAFNPVGGTVYLGQNGVSSATQGTHIFLPKVGAVFTLTPKTVIRAGWGMYMDTFNVSNDRLDTNGYNLGTSTPITNDNGLTFCCGIGAAGNIGQGKTPIHDPFPVRADGTRFNEPLQNYLGGLARVGGGFNFLPWDYRPALQHRWRIGIQREIMRNLMVDISYNGAYSYIPVSQRVNYLPEQFWTKGMRRDQKNDDFLNQNVANPFRASNLVSVTDPVLKSYINATGFFTSANIRRHQLLRPFPQFTGDLNGIRPGEDWKSTQGYNKYHDMQVLVDRRFGNGFNGTFMYTWASGYEADFYNNQFDARPTERIQDAIRPHRIAISGLYELPFGKGRRLVKDGFMSWVIGNWNTSAIFQWQTGNATGWGNRFFYGTDEDLKNIFKHKEVNSKDIHTWFDPNIVWRGSGDPPAGFVGFEGRSAAQPGSYHVRVFPTRLDYIREDGILNWDLKVERIFPIAPDQGIQARFSVDLLNAFNHTNFSGPNTDPTSGNFGKVTSQRGLPRVIQFNLRFDF